MTNTKTNTEFLHPDRTALRIRPLKAWRHFRKLIANKEETEHAFHVIEALSGKAILGGLKTLSQSEEGAKRIAQRRYLPPLLDDHKKLGELPPGSVGAVYVEFMQREGLSAAGLVAEFDKFGKHTKKYGDLLEWYSNRLRDTHDLFHILTGYGRDALGEACVLAFSHGQSPSPGSYFIGYMTGREIKKRAPAGAQVMAAVREGKHSGRRAGRIVAQDILELLTEPLEHARARLGIKPPDVYRGVHKDFIAAGLDPYQAVT